MSVIVGLDVSTSITGICVIDSNILPDDKGSHILLLDKIDFKKCKNFWEKTDAVHEYLSSLSSRQKADVVALEEPLLGFQKGMSSAATITTLMRFNGIVSYISRSLFNLDPTYIASASARKICGVKLQQRKKCGKSHKEQVFEHMSQHDLKHVVWPTKKSGAHIDAAGDMTDAYVIARAACLMNISNDK